MEQSKKCHTKPIIKDSIVSGLFLKMSQIKQDRTWSVPGWDTSKENLGATWNFVGDGFFFFGGTVLNQYSNSDMRRQGTLVEVHKIKS